MIFVIDIFLKLQFLKHFTKIMPILRSRNLERTLIYQNTFLWISAIYNSIKLPFDEEVPEKFVNLLMTDWQSNVAKCLFDICKAEMAQWRQKSWNLDIQSQFSMSKKRPNLSKTNFIEEYPLRTSFFVEYIFW